MAKNQRSEVKAEEKTVLTYSDVAKMFGKSPQTIRRWCLEGLIPSFRLPSGIRAMQRADVVKFFSGTTIEQQAEA